MTNAELAQKLRDLHDFLVIAGYEESHATRYPQIARHIDKMAEDVNVMRREGRLGDIPGVGKLIVTYIKQYLDTGRCEKLDEWEKVCPLSVLELVRIPGLGAKTGKRLFQEFGIASLADLKSALDAGRLDGIPGFGPKTLAAWRTYEPDL